jgi:hypothetical protein
MKAIALLKISDYGTILKKTMTSMKLAIRSDRKRLVNIIFDYGYLKIGEQC